MKSTLNRIWRNPFVSALIGLTAMVGAARAADAADATRAAHVEHASAAAQGRPIVDALPSDTALPLVIPAATRQVRIAARLVDEAGAPLAGAVLFSSGGGQAVTNANGHAELEVALDGAARSLYVTGAASIAGRNLLGSRAVSLSDRDGEPISVGTIMLAAGAECEPAWVPTFGPATGIAGFPDCMAVFDDGKGGGPALYVGGITSVAAGELIHGIAKWDGSSWSTLGSGVDLNVVRALIVFDDGTGGGPALFVGGNFSTAGGMPAQRVAKWDGTSWSALGSGLSGPVSALAVFDDGSGGGSALFAAGSFLRSESVIVNRVAKWNGSLWLPLGNGLSGGNGVEALTVFDDGEGGGPALYAAGSFHNSGGAPVNRVAKWDGASWSQVGSGIDNNTVHDLTVYDDGTGDGPAMYAGGTFTSIGGAVVNRIAKWDGQSWTGLGDGMNSTVHSMIVADDGTGAGQALYAGGAFTTAGGVAADRVAKWDGSSWSTLGSGMGGTVYTLGAFDDGKGGNPILYAGGPFNSIGETIVDGIARWNGKTWSGLGAGMAGTVLALAVFDDGGGDGPALYAGGEFSIIGGSPINHIAKWNGSSWSALGTGVTGGQVLVMRVLDLGSGEEPALYVAGDFVTAGEVTVNGIAKWNGSVWSALGSGVNSLVYALADFDDGLGSGPALYAGGFFTTAGGITANRIAKWDGSEWSPVGSGMDDGAVAVIAVFDDGLGRGPSLYAGGNFTSSGGKPVSRIAKWDGESWSPLGTGTSDLVWALREFDDGGGDGPSLYASGNFASAGGVTVNYIARWDGTSWSALGQGLNGSAVAMTVFDDGAGDGPALYAAGGFTTAGGMPASRIAKWDGSSWSTLGDGQFGNLMWALATMDGEIREPPALYAAGSIIVSPSGDGGVAKWQGCPIDTVSLADINGDGAVDGADLAILLGSWGPCSGCVADLNGDGAVSGEDLAIVLGAWTG